ncbi:fumarylacetoacetate hydrolase family protein [Leekyejoonella antrihumi]|uniref:Fumarylacetoacetate hydrolase family protein n=1 Tax=Leekyejoonella antrihumi TaxID=1660198 RepID=A0A563DZ92_9MICO|nr:fumarylacetoacetate hydrolase family protein [Leekyejoonella antrihumi]TWP35439.1 fumarylacetoacetate hydrolase family protein [Leekyejoonella antrihumi]
MRLVRVGAPGSERPGVIDGAGVLRDLSPLTADIDAAFLAGDWAADVRSALEADTLPTLEPGRLGAPIARPGNVVGIGLNYADHAARAGVAVPSEPIVFLKASSSVVGPTDVIRIPSGSTQTDWEAELGVVIGAPLRLCDDPDQALRSIAGLVAADDVTEREHAASGPTWAKGKCHDTFCPIGPWLVSPDEVGDLQDLRIELWVNGERRQAGSTAQMTFGVGELLAYVSRHMTLHPGDLVLTGTPGGVAGHHASPAPYLRAGDVVELEVTGLGRQRTHVVAHDDVSARLTDDTARSRPEQVPAGQETRP